LQRGGAGQFDVLVDGQVVASRQPSVLQRVMGGGWPDPEEVIAAISARMGKS
jgi:hypothetical protein